MSLNALVRRLARSAVSRLTCGYGAEMNISDYLNSFDSKKSKVNKCNWEKRRITVRLKRNNKWKSAFMSFNNEANARQLAAALNIDDPCSVNQMMRIFIKEGLVVKTREESNGTKNGKRFYYKWIGE